jgi:hypothetical protein
MNTDTYGWVYGYDRPSGVWRAFNTTGAEINQFHKDQLFLLMDRLRDAFPCKSSKINRVPFLTNKERQEFLVRIE